MASFQSLMGVEESEDNDVMSKQDGSTGGSIKTRDYLSDGENFEAGKENHPPSMMPSKKRRLGLSQGCEVEIREVSSPTLHFSLAEEEEASVKQKQLLSSDTGEAAQVLVIFSPFNDCELPVLPDAQLWSPTEKQQEAVFELQSLDQPTPDDPADASPARPVSHFQIPSMSSLLEMKPTADSMTSPAVKKKKKQVRFGEPLSPELFDKDMPPSTPLQKGGTPAHVPTPGGNLMLRSLLKTPQRANSPTPQPQRELHSPSMIGASPTLSMPCSRWMTSTEEDRSEMDRKIPFPSEEIEREGDNTAEYILNTRPLYLDTAFYEESLSQIEREFETKAPETTSPMDILSHEPLKEEETQPQTDSEAPASGRSSKKRGKVTHDATEAPARSSSRKRKLPEENEPVKRSTRSAAKTASRKMKTTSTATRQWNKKVDRSLYGCREYASKNPSLSPITEMLSFSQSSVAQQSLSDTCTALSQEPHLDLRCNGKSVSADPTTEVVNNTSETGDTALNASTTPEGSVSFPMSSRRSGTRRNRRLSGPKVRGKALKREKFGVYIDQEGSKLHDKFEENTSDNCENETNKKASEKGQSKETIIVCHKVVSETLCAASSLHTTSIGLKEESESPAVLDSPTSASLPAGEEFKHTMSLSTQGEAEQCQEGQPKDDKINQVEKEQGDQTVCQQKNNQSGSVSHEEEAADQLVLLPWQTDYNFEDVFKPVAPRRQRTVRRSLRNQSSTDQSDGGLAWLPHTSPESIRESRRRTRGRRLSAVLPNLATEVTQP